MPNEIDPQQMHQLLASYLEQKKHNLSDFDRSDAEHLLNNTLQGLDSAQYLAGHKKKEVETFYDKHPIQATVQDAVNTAPAAAGLGLGAQVGHSAFKDWNLNRKIHNLEKTYRQKDGLKPLTHKDFDERPDLQRAFPRTMREFGEQPNQMSEMYNKLEQFRPDLQKHDDSYIGKMLGAEGRQDERLTRAFSRHHPKGITPDQTDLEPMLRELGDLHPERAARVADSVVNRVKNPTWNVRDVANQFHPQAGSHMDKFKMFGKDIGKHVGNVPVGKANTLSHINPKAVMAAGGVAGAGLALSPLLRFIQRKTYGNDKVKQWNHARRQSEGKFNEDE